MIVGFKGTDDPHVIPADGGNILGLTYRGLLMLKTVLAGWLSRKRVWIFSPDIFPISMRPLKKHLLGVQVINLHWVANFVTSSLIRGIAQITGAPVVWTLMDVAPLTGGCHYFGDCSGYTGRCGNCPQLRCGFSYDISRLSMLRKAKNLGEVPITIVAPTQWVADHVRRSSLFGRCRVVNIPLGVDSEVFHPVESSIARDAMQLPRDKKLIFFGAALIDEERKGFRYLLEALSHLHGLLLGGSGLSVNDVELVVAGKGDMTGLDDSPFKYHHLGLLRGDNKLALAYQASDVFVCPSIDDAGPMMVNESLMCGTPVVAFDSGAAHDFVEHMKTGCLAEMKDSVDLAKGIAAILKNEDPEGMKKACREGAMREFSLEVQVERYLKLYEELAGDRTAA
jgi:glycosyltransferase involved in cell wall biosynthesis